MLPFDPKNPCDIHLTYESGEGLRSAHLTVDTEQSALQWRRALEAALFRQTRRRWRENITHKKKMKDPDYTAPDDQGWQTIRLCIPLDRAKLIGISNYHGFATLASLEVLLQGEHVQWHPEDISGGDFTGSISKRDMNNQTHTPKQRKSFLHPTRSLTRSTRSKPRSAEHSPSRRGTQDSTSHAPPGSPDLFAGPPHPHIYIETTMGQQADPVIKGDDNTHYHFNVAVLNDQASFTDAMGSVIDVARKRRYRPGVEHPRMVLEIAGYDVMADDDDDVDLQSLDTPAGSSDEMEDEHGGLLTELRKAEKASIAAKAFGLREEEGIYSECESKGSG